MSADLEPVYREYKSAMLAVALNITQCPGLAEDAIQNAFEKVFRSLREYPVNSFGKKPADSNKAAHSLTPKPKNNSPDRNRQANAMNSNARNPTMSPSMNSLSRPENLKAYLFQAVRHAAIDIRRRKKRRQPESNISFFEMNHSTHNRLIDLQNKMSKPPRFKPLSTSWKNRTGRSFS